MGTQSDKLRYVPQKEATVPDVAERAKNAGRAEPTAHVIIAAEDVIVRPGDVPGRWTDVTHQTSDGGAPAGGEFQIQAGHAVPIELEAAYRAAVGDSQADDETVVNTVAPNTRVVAGSEE